MAIQVTREDFRREFPEFPESVIDNPMLDRLLERAARFHTVTRSGTLYAAAHLYTLDLVGGRKGKGSPSMGKAIIGEGGKADGGLGVVKKETIGPKSVEYVTNADDNARKAFWVTSPYGREFILIEQRNVRQGFGMLLV